MENKAQTFTDAQIGEQLFLGTSGQEMCEKLGISEATFSRRRERYMFEYIKQLKEASTTRESKLHLSETEKQKALTELQRLESNSRGGETEIKKALTDLQVITTELQRLESKLHLSETEKQKALTDLQLLETEKQKALTDLQWVERELQDMKEAEASGGEIFEQRVLTHPRFLLLSIVVFESYNSAQLFSNMRSQDYPIGMATMFAMFFGVSAVTTLCSGNKLGTILCILAGFISNAIHVDLFSTPTPYGFFFTILPCLLIAIFAQMFAHRIK
jgi:hypothetical protein